MTTAERVTDDRSITQNSSSFNKIAAVPRCGQNSCHNELADHFVVPDPIPSLAKPRAQSTPEDCVQDITSEEQSDQEIQYVFQTRRVTLVFQGICLDLETSKLLWIQ